MRDDLMSIREAVPSRRAEALVALAANLVGGHLVVPTYLIAADADVHPDGADPDYGDLGQAFRRRRYWPSDARPHAV